MIFLCVVIKLFSASFVPPSHQMLATPLELNTSNCSWDAPSSSCNTLGYSWRLEMATQQNGT